MRVRQPPSKSKSQKWRLKLGRLLSPHHKETDDADIVSSSAEWDTKSVGKEEHGSFDDPESTSAAIERFGLFTVNTEIAETTVDIVAVHGLGGHYQTTWTWFPTNPNTSSPCNWLEDLLPHEFPNARIMSFGYNSAVVHSKSVGDISTFAEQLLQFLSRERFSREQKIRPIIFICHSLGGIVVKKVIHCVSGDIYSQFTDSHRC
jgi:hypothetical protein